MLPRMRVPKMVGLSGSFQLPFLLQNVSSAFKCESDSLVAFKWCCFSYQMSFPQVWIWRANLSQPMSASVCPEEMSWLLRHRWMIRNRTIVIMAWESDLNWHRSQCQRHPWTMQQKAATDPEINLCTWKSKILLDNLTILPWRKVYVCLGIRLQLVPSTV